MRLRGDMFREANWAARPPLHPAVGKLAVLTLHVLDWHGISGDYQRAVRGKRLSDSILPVSADGRLAIRIGSYALKGHTDTFARATHGKFSTARPKTDSLPAVACLGVAAVLSGGAAVSKGLILKRQRSAIGRGGGVKPCRRPGAVC